MNRFFLSQINSISPGFSPVQNSDLCTIPGFSRKCTSDISDNQAHDYQNALARVSQCVPTYILEVSHLNFKTFFPGLVSRNDRIITFAVW